MFHDITVLLYFDQINVAFKHEKCTEPLIIEQ